MSNTYMLWCKRQRGKDKGNLVLGDTGTWKNLKGKKTHDIRQIPPRVDRWLLNYRQRENLVKCYISYPCSKLNPNVKCVCAIDSYFLHQHLIFNQVYFKVYLGRHLCQVAL